MYQVIRNNELIDVLDNIQYVRKNPRNGVILSCNEEKAQGVISYDGKTIYWMDSVTLEPITEIRFKRLRDLLDCNEPVKEADTPIVEENPKGEVREPMSITEMRERINLLEQSVGELLEQVDILKNSN